MVHYPSSIIHRPSSMRAFTLIEVLIAALLLGLSVAALVVANGTLTIANGAGADLSTSEFLIEQIRELTAMLPVSDPASTTWATFGAEEGSLADYDDVDDFDGASFSPPVSAGRATLGDFGSFRQQVTVQNVNRSNLDQVVSDRTSQFIRITVNVLQNGRQISTASWVRARY